MHVNPDGSQRAMRAEETGAGYADCRIIVLAKEPVAARVKTRLCPPLAPETAAECHEAFVVDTLARARSAAPDADCVLASTPAPDLSPKLVGLARSYGWRMADQGDGDLGERMRRALSESAGERRRTILIGADTPDLPLAYLQAAFASLERASLVLGPASDGGYYLVGCRDRVPEIFGPGIAWGTSTVWRDTLARARRSEAASAIEILPEWSDVDDWAGLTALAARLAGNGARIRDDDEQLPTATIRFLDGLRAAGAAL